MNNSKIELSEQNFGYIFRQSDPTVSDIRYGVSRQKVKNVGCGIVAIYNVMLSLNKPQSFAEIAAEARKLRIPWLFGFFGTKPRSLGRYFDKMEIPYSRTDSAEEFCSGLEKCSAAIICTWNDRRSEGIHFYSIINDGGRLTSLNRFCNETKPSAFSPESVRGDRFITGYLLPQEGSAPISTLE